MNPLVFGKNTKNSPPTTTIALLTQNQMVINSHHHNEPRKQPKQRDATADGSGSEPAHTSSLTSFVHAPEGSVRCSFARNSFFFSFFLAFFRQHETTDSLKKKTKKPKLVCQDDTCVQYVCGGGYKFNNKSCLYAGECSLVMLCSFLLYIPCDVVYRRCDYRRMHPETKKTKYS